MPTCPSCGEENPYRARHCMICGTALTTAITRPEERKVVTVLFCDLVGFTARSEGQDVEDVRGTLVPYHDLVRSELERFGGTVEKFIGDAVMALFGAPIVREDDPERAVRAALSIREAVERFNHEQPDLDLHVRIGINTGEALVALGARPEAGEAMAAGDVVNTAARLQTAAPVDGILVGEVTYRATKQPIDYEEAKPVSAKGKAEPVPVWLAQSARARFGTDVRQEAGTPLVGRERELRLLVEALDRSRAEQSPQLATLVGVPGIGKSRLVWELFRRADELPELVSWRQGRSLPYGEGVPLWALGEIVKAEAGILDSDRTDIAERKLEKSVFDLISEEEDARWVFEQLRPLVGLEAEARPGADRQVEGFSAARRFLEALAARGPLVLVFEDLQWADEALLDFLDYLLEWASGVPVLVLCTGRPELYERRKGWGGGKPNALTIALSPLSESDTARLVAGLLEQAVLPVEAQQALLARAEGNPLYAEEYIRMLVDRGFLVHEGGRWRLEDESKLPLPESVQGLIAARLDALTAEEKALLQAASVFGKVVWLGVVAQIAGVDRSRAEELLHRLERKEFLRRERQSSVATDIEYAFRHVLVREVAYAQIPRARRAEHHERAAEWIASLAGERDDKAELLAHHYQTALELARASGTETDELVGKTRLALRDAGEHALALNSFASARLLLQAALVDWPENDPARPFLLLSIAKARLHGEDDLAPELLTAARELERDGAREAASEAELLAGQWLWNHGRAEEATEREERALSLVEGLPPSPAQARALISRAQSLILRHRVAEGIELCRRVLAIAEEFGLAELRANSLIWLALGGLLRDDPSALSNLKPSLALASSTSPVGLSVHGNAATVAIALGDLGHAAQLGREMQDGAERLGLSMWLYAAAALEASSFYFGGRWKEAEGLVDRLLGESADPRPDDSRLRVLRARMHMARGELAPAIAETEAAVWLATRFDISVLYPAFAWQARLLVENGRQTQAHSAIDELLTEPARLLMAGWTVGDLALATVATGREGEFVAAAERVRTPTPWRDAAVALARGRYEEAAEIYARIGSLPDEADARLLAGKRLAEKRVPEAEEQLARALGFFRRVGATAREREAQALLERMKNRQSVA